MNQVVGCTVERCGLTKRSLSWLFWLMMFKVWDLMYKFCTADGNWIMNVVWAGRMTACYLLLSDGVQRSIYIFGFL